MNAPFRLSAAETAVRDFSAALGEHTEAVLRELGYAAGDIAALADKGVIGGGRRPEA
jgi:crotonobetainyl-CoA:carnitine CoA-transferase CaiB-like acyl-CoA transferase